MGMPSKQRNFIRQTFEMPEALMTPTTGGSSPSWTVPRLRVAELAGGSACPVRPWRTDCGAWRSPAR